MSCFQNLSHTLEETFAATVQSENELNYASATLILAGLLQIHARTPKYASHRVRLESFPNWSIEKRPNIGTRQLKTKPIAPSPAEFASAGFFHTGVGDETVCPACGLGLRDWQTADQPESCHIAYSTAARAALEMNISEDQKCLPTPVLPCLYLAVHRLIVSEIPLARKSLVPVGSVQSTHNMSGVITSPCVHGSNFHKDSHCEYPSLADRLRAISQIMAAPPTPQGWPVENARALGHSDDLIVLALWRLQAEAAGMSLACPSAKSIELDPQSTAELLRAVLRVQEGFDVSITTNIEFGGLDSVDSDVVYHNASTSEQDITVEDAETAELSSCYCQRLHPPIANSTIHHPTNIVESNVKRACLPQFYQFLVWWSDRWPQISTATAM